MIPVSLSIEGLYSYRSKQTINFSSLTKTKLFGIFGHVGSGKSSILEAISFALYGETERLSKQDNRGYNMMNLQSDEMTIDFEFTTGSPETRYRFTVQAKRSKKDPQQIRTPKRIAYKWNGEDWLAMDSADAEKVIGINYSNFKRTVIIPQGKFMEFMQLKPAERTNMLKELFNLHQFELYPQAAKLEAANNEALHRLKGALEQLGTIDIKDVEAFEAKATELHAEKKHAEKLVTELETAFKRIDKEKEAAEAIDLLTQSLQVLVGKEPEMDKRKHLLGQYERCFRVFSGLFQKKDELSARKSNLVDLISSRNTELKILSDKKIELDSEFEKQKKTVEQNEVDRRKADDLAIVLDINDKQSKKIAGQKRLAEGEEHVKKVQADIVTQKTVFEKLQASVSELRPLREQVKQLQAKELVMQEYELAGEKLEMLKKQLLETEELIRKESAVKAEAFQCIGTEHTDITIFDQIISKCQLELKDMRDVLDQLRLEYKLSHYSQNLTPGEACPVCGSTEHPKKIVPAELDEAIAKQLQKIQEAENQIENIRQNKHKITIAEAELVRLREKRSQQDKNLHAETISRNNILGKIDGPALGLKVIQKQLAILLQQEKQLEGREKQLQEVYKQLSELQEKETKYRGAVQKIQSEVTGLEAEVNTLFGSVKHIRVSDYKDADSEQIKLERSSLVQLIKQREERFEQLRESIQTFTSKHDSLQGQLKSNEEELGKVVAALTEMQTEMLDALKLNAYETEAEVRTVLKADINTEEEKKELDAFFIDLKLKEEKLAELKRLYPNLKFNAEHYAKVKQQLQEQKDILLSLHAKITENELKRKELEAKSKQITELTKQLQATEYRAENIKTVKELFKGAGFVNYVSTVYLQNLCNTANTRFYRLTKQKLKLELGADNSFQVRDYLNNGELRSVKTLSGGQSFQAALSLALALSDSIQLHNNYKQNFFFLDEGFGSQDSESLSLIFETFASLRAENKTVGIISHVEELKESIASYIQVKNEEETGSVVI